MLNTILGAFSSGVAASTSSYESIQSYTATGGETAINFNSIPGTYVSLQIRGIVKTTSTSNFASNIGIQFNSDTGNNYAHHYLYGDGSAVAASGAITADSVNLEDFGARSASQQNNMYGAGIIDIHNYASTTQNKTVRAFYGIDTNQTGFWPVQLKSGLWLNTNAITSIRLKINSGTAFSAGTTFALYGIKG